MHETGDEAGRGEISGKTRLGEAGLGKKEGKAKSGEKKDEAGLGEEGEARLDKTQLGEKGRRVWPLSQQWSSWATATTCHS